MKSNILLFSTLFPNQVRPRHGVFVETRLHQLLARFPVYNVFVVAPIAWFPFKSKMFGRWSENIGVPDTDTIKDIPVQHPRFISIPKIGESLAPLLLALGTFRRCAALHKKHKFELIDAHYAYPDGVAATMIGKWLEIPVVVTARGTDINFIPNHFIARSWVKWMLKHCSHNFAVSDALRNDLLALGADPKKVTTVRNGVDAALFQPLNQREALRKKLNWTEYTVLSVANLAPLKGHHLIIDAITKLPDFHLVIIGKGTEFDSLQAKIKQRKLEHRVSILNEISQQELVEYYNAADVSVLGSSREGMPNVSLEALSCGTPVVATAVGGIPEVVNNDDVGLLVEQNADSMANGLKHVKEHPRSREAIVEHAKLYGWGESIAILQRQFQDSINDVETKTPTLENE